MLEPADSPSQQPLNYPTSATASYNRPAWTARVSHSWSAKRLEARYTACNPPLRSGGQLSFGVTLQGGLMASARMLRVRCGSPRRRDLPGPFQRALLLESEIPGGPGEVPHFLAVSSYILQHPEAMNYTAEALAGCRKSVADQLAGRATLEQLRHRVRRAVNGPQRVTRRSGDPVPRWPVTAWSRTVTDVLAGGTEGYAGRVEQWANSIIRTLDAAET